MEYEWDPEKDAANVLKHGLSFADFQGFDSDPLMVSDDRFDEPRFRLFGLIDGKGHCLVVTPRGRTLRLISFRRARPKEMARYE